MRSESQAETIRQLADRLRRLESPGNKQTGARDADHDCWSTGFTALDQLLPDHGLVSGSFVEWLHAGTGSGTTSLVLNVLSSVLESRLAVCSSRHQSTGHPVRSSASRIPVPALVMIDSEGQFSAAGVARDSLLWKHLVVTRPERTADALWAWEQSLRCPGVLGAVYWGESLPERQLRRLKLAAEVGGGLGMLIRSLRWRRTVNWADVRIEVRSVRHQASLNATHQNMAEEATGNWGLRECEVRLLSCRGAWNRDGRARLKLGLPGSVDRSA